MLRRLKFIGGALVIAWLVAGLVEMRVVSYGMAHVIQAVIWAVTVLLITRVKQPDIQFHVNGSKTGRTSSKEPNYANTGKTRDFSSLQPQQPNDRD